MRMRFNKEERAAFILNAEIEWRNGRHWHPGTVIGEIVCRDGWDNVLIRNDGESTSTVSKGAHVAISPTAIRVPSV